MSGEKTEEPTPKREREARERGQVPKSRKLGSALLLLTCAFLVGARADSLLAGFRALFEPALARARGEGTAPIGGAIALGLDVASAELLPILLAFVGVAVFASIAQTGPVLATKAVRFSLEHLDPVAGAKRLFGKDAWVELLRSILEVGIILFVVVGVLEDAARGAITLVGRDASALGGTLGATLRTLFLRTGGAMLAIAALDVLYQRYRHRRELRMTKEEVKREHKESDGDPHAKGERDRVRRELAQHDTAEAVRRASVVVVNPTHLAVALAWDEDEDDAAPEVVAKGMEDEAMRIRRLAEEAGVPIVRDVPLARGLFQLELGDEIPERLYDAVAAVLQIAWEERGEP